MYSIFYLIIFIIRDLLTYSNFIVLLCIFQDMMSHSSVGAGFARSLISTFTWLFTAMLSRDVNEAYYIIYQVITDYH